MQRTDAYSDACTNGFPIIGTNIGTYVLPNERTDLRADVDTSAGQAPCG
jgi:hypothetical protein